MHPFSNLPFYNELEHHFSNQANHIDHRVANIDPVASQALLLVLRPLLVVRRQLQFHNEYLQQIDKERPEYVHEHLELAVHAEQCVLQGVPEDKR